MTPQGGVDRKALANLVFKNFESGRKKLEVAVHPWSSPKAETGSPASCATTGSPAMVFYDAALLVETGRHEQFHRLVVVVKSTAPEIQLQRLMERDHLTFTQAGARLPSSFPQKAAPGRLSDR